MQHVKEPTHGVMLDLFLSDFPGEVETYVAPPVGCSDHCVVHAKLHQVPTIVEPPTSRRVWQYNLADWDRLKAFYRDSDWDEIISEDPKVTCQKLTDHIIRGMHRFIPSAIMKTRPADPLWWNPECTTAVATKRRAWKHLRRSPTSEDRKVSYTLACKLSSTCLARAKAAHFAMISAKLSSGSLRDKQWWSTIKRDGGHGRDSSIPVLVKPYGLECCTSKEKSECLGEYLAKKCSFKHRF